MKMYIYIFVYIYLFISSSSQPLVPLGGTGVPEPNPILMDEGRVHPGQVTSLMRGLNFYNVMASNIILKIL